MKNLLFFTLISALWLGCQEQKDGFLIEYGYEYFPLEVGKFKVFQVDSVVYNPVSGGTSRDSTRTFVRETLIEKFSGEDGGAMYKIEHAERRSESNPWVVKNIWTCSRDENRAYRTEENLKFVPLVFPIQVRKNWNSLVFIDPFLEVEIAGEPIEIFKEWSSEVLADPEPETIGNFDFEKILTVSHADAESKIELRFVQEKYAAGLGLVFKEMKILDTQCIEPCQNQSWEEKAEKGFILKQVLIAHN